MAASLFLARMRWHSFLKQVTEAGWHSAESIVSPLGQTFFFFFEAQLHLFTRWMTLTKHVAFLSFAFLIQLIGIVPALQGHEKLRKNSTREHLPWIGYLTHCSYYYYIVLLLVHSFLILPVDSFADWLEGQMEEEQDRGRWAAVSGPFALLKWHTNQTGSEKTPLWSL